MSVDQPTDLVRKLGLFDASMIVMGGIIGSGIFMNPSVVARIVHSPELILGAWLVGGCIAIAGAFIYAELAARRPQVGGQYVYLREAYHPLIAFLFGWTLFLVSNCGGMAAVAMTFARYFIELTHVPLSENIIAVSAVVVLTIINCFGVRAGSTVQNVLMVTKILAILMLVIFGTMMILSMNTESVPAKAIASDSLTTFGAALIPVMFAFGGWQTANFIAGEIREPEKNLPRGLLLGVTGVIALYFAVNIVCLWVLGAEGLAETKTPATSVMRMALGETGAQLIAIGITVSTLGFLSQSVLTAPRVYFAMASDGLFFTPVAKLHPRTHVPVAAIVMQGALTSVIALSGQYEQILSYVVSNDFVFFGLTASCLFIFRNCEKRTTSFNMPGHPVSTAIFIAVCAFVVINSVYKYPLETGIGFGIMLTGIPVFFIWNGRKNKP
jgi:APA family basic amino acid/polyamine antiporter